MKKVLKLLIPIVLLTVSFCGCNYESQELKSRLIVQAIGIDAMENGGVRVTLQTLNTEMAGNPNSGANLGGYYQFCNRRGEYSFRCNFRRREIRRKTAFAFAKQTDCFRQGNRRKGDI